MGEVYLAEDSKLERQVALKFLPKHLTIDKEARERFEREAKAAAALNHPNIVTVYEIGEHEGQVFIAMEYVEGKTLKDIISVGTGRDPLRGPLALSLPITSCPLPLAQVLDIAAQIASGLAAAHAKGIVHRDIKPQNILVDKSNHVKILDFGLAKLKGVSPLTKESSTLGTVHYMSPEQTMGKDVDQRSDIWSLGVVLYEMLTGRPPFKGDYEQAVIYSILNEEPEPLSKKRPDVPSDLETIVGKCLEKEIDIRTQHADDLLADLKRAKRDSKPVSTAKAQPTAATPVKKKQWLKVAASLFLVIAISTVAAYFLIKGKPGPKIPPPGKTAAAPAPQKAKAENSIAVLPFRDYRGQKEQDYFCYNITDAVVNRLAQVEGLKVRPTAAVMRFKDVDQDPVEIGRELKVSHIVSGTVQKEASRVRLTVQLIDAQSGFQEWNEKYDEELSPRNLFMIQDKMSQAIADKLKLTLSRQALQGLSSAQPQNLEAYDYYSRGIYLIQYRYMISTRKEDFENSVKMFEKAIAIDPNFWQAYFGMFWAYRHYYDVTRTGTPEDYQRTLGYLEEAYRISPNVPETQLGMAYVYFAKDDYDKWYEICRKAEGSSSNQMVHMHAFGLCFQKLGLYGQSEKYYLKSIALDPYFFSLDNLGGTYLNWGKVDQAEACYQRLLDMAPNNVLSLLDFVDLNIVKKNPAAAEEYLARAEKKDAKYPLLVYYRSLLYAAKGDKEKALAINQNPEIEIYALLNMNDEAFAKIRKNTKDGSCIYLRLLHSPYLKNLRSDPRFPEIVREQKAIYDERLKKYGDL